MLGAPWKQNEHHIWGIQIQLQRICSHPYHIWVQWSSVFLYRWGTLALPSYDNHNLIKWKQKRDESMYTLKPGAKWKLLLKYHDKHCITQ